MSTEVVFESFYEDKEAWDMYITGRAGTGKTTSLAKLVEICISNKISYCVCAYTHKACNVLRSKLPEGAKVKTLHSFLRKVPTINTEAKRMQELEGNKTIGLPDNYSILFIDEFSMIGEKDLMDLRALQDPHYEGMPRMKIVYLGDPNQLPPVKDQIAIVPTGEYVVTLTKIYRQAGGNELLDTLGKLADYIEGEEPAPLAPNKNFIRGLSNEDLLKEFMQDTKDKVYLTYTNENVQYLNQIIQGRVDPAYWDNVFCNQNRDTYKFHEKLDSRNVKLVTLFNKEDLVLNSKYKTLEFLIEEPSLCHFGVISDEEITYTIPYVFGTYNYKCMLDTLGKEAVDSNEAIEKEFRVANATDWVKRNPTHKLARARARAWRRYLTFKDCVWCLDFPHAMTVHKSQGSTFDNVYLDMVDLNRAAKMDFNLYLKLAYVAISRARNNVYTN